uniref:Uncharacterized protein n=1 Tax=Photinus pyralis TaxID=7054 RepID=A0A1Y1NII3_PHOPY
MTSRRWDVNRLCPWYCWYAWLEEWRPVRPDDELLAFPILKSWHKKCFNADRKSRRWYAYSSGFPAELAWERMMQNNIMFSLAWKQSAQNDRMKLMVYSGIQQIMKNKTMIERF